MKEKTIKLNEATIKILSNLLEYEADKLREAEKRDEFKDNGYLIDACEQFIKATAEATENEQSHDEKKINALYKSLMTDANTSDEQKSEFNKAVFFYNCGRFNALQVLARFMLCANNKIDLIYNDFNNNIVLNILSDEAEAEK